jgi:cardiolipin synthase
MPWQRESIWTDGDAWFDDLVAAIAQARQRVWCETYILATDPLGARVVEALRQAAHRGCQVRLLVDGVGSAAWVRAVDGGRDPCFRDCPLDVRVWNPLPWAIAKRAGLARRWRWLLAVNRRDHRKVCLIDDGVAWVGSFNAEGCHVRAVHGAARWRDTGARVVGPDTEALASAFTLAWRRAWPLVAGHLRPTLALPTLRRTPSSPLVRLNHTATTRRATYRDLLRRLRTAQRRIWITNAYVVPKGSLLRTLAAAARRGVDVRVLAPAKSDHAVMPWVAASFADGLLRAGARVWAYTPRVLHAKTMLIDDLALVGSHNLNHRSLVHDLEAEVVLDHPATLAALATAYLADLSEAVELHPPVMAGLRWWQRLAARLALLGKRWL